MTKTEAMNLRSGDDVVVVRGTHAPVFCQVTGSPRNEGKFVVVPVFTYEDESYITPSHNDIFLR